MTTFEDHLRGRLTTMAAKEQAEEARRQQEQQERLAAEQQLERDARALGLQIVELLTSKGIAPGPLCTMDEETLDYTVIGQAWHIQEVHFRDSSTTHIGINTGGQLLYLHLNYVGNAHILGSYLSPRAALDKMDHTIEFENYQEREENERAKFLDSLAQLVG